MPEDFNSAFAAARKSGASTFNYNGKSYSTKYKEEKIFDELMNEYPKLKNIYNKENTIISFADDKRRELNKKYGGGGGLETWFPDDEGPKEFPHPSLGKFNFEVYDKNIYDNEKTLKAAVFLDMLHGMKKDKEWSDLRNQFNQKWDPDELEFLKKKHKEESYKDESLGDYFDRTVIDGYLRGGINPMSDDDLKNGSYNDEYAQMYRGLFYDGEKKLNPYTRQQREIIEKMKGYLKSK